VNSISIEEDECGIISVDVSLTVGKTFSVTKGLDVLCKYSFVYTHMGETFAVGCVLDRKLSGSIIAYSVNNIHQIHGP
jgi:hypothetical protein